VSVIQRKNRASSSRIRSSPCRVKISATVAMVSSTPAKFEPFSGNFVHVAPPYCYRYPFGLSYPSCGLACVKNIEATIDVPQHRRRPYKVPLRTGAAPSEKCEFGLIDGPLIWRINGSPPPLPLTAPGREWPMMAGAEVRCAGPLWLGASRSAGSADRRRGVEAAVHPIATHYGRLVKTTGTVEFSSVVDALECTSGMWRKR
jgi:hypothetical protein